MITMSSADNESHLLDYADSSEALRVPAVGPGARGEPAGFGMDSLSEREQNSSVRKVSRQFAPGVMAPSQW